MKTQRIRELENLILYHKEKYYQGKAEISDESYDQLEQELETLDPENPVLQFVGPILSDVSKKVEHQRKMLSLEKTYEEDSLKKWVNHEEVISIFKIDGSSCSLIYENGHLKMAKTRGDGQFGENITKKAFFIEDIPKFVPEDKTFEVRGEVYCVEKKFFLLSQEMKELGLESPSSQRNIVAGLLGRKENIQLCRYLSFQAFDYLGDKFFSREHQKLNHLKEMGFVTPEFVIHKGINDLSQRIQEAKDFMGGGDYLIDGLVFVYENIKLHEELGETGHHPRYKLAFKFAGETKITEIEKIEWGVSRNGILTPVALIHPTELSGAMISRVTLHNFGLVKNFNLKIGDQIEIIRSGEVIPKFLSVVRSSEKDFSYPSICPSCHSSLKVEDIWLFCENEKCPAKIKEEILNFIHKSGIEEVSDKRLEEMINKGLVEKISDLYKLTEKDFLVLDKVKEKLAKKMFDNIQKTKVIDLARFISAIGVEGVSINKSEKIISNGYDSLEKFLALKVENLLSIEGFAEKSSTAIINSIKLKKRLIHELLAVGVVVKSSTPIVQGVTLSGLKFCITGELSQPRPMIEKMIKEHGGIIAGVSKNLDYLVTNETESSSSKFLKAKSLGIPILNEEELMKKMEERSGKE